MKFKKHILLFILLFSFSFVNSQQSNLQEDTCFTEKQVIDIANKIYNLKQKDSINIRLINKQEKKVRILKNRIKRDSIMLSLYKKKLDIQKNRKEFYKERAKKYQKRLKWSFVGGVGVTVISSLVLNWALN